MKKHTILVIIPLTAVISACNSGGGNLLSKIENLKPAEYYQKICESSGGYFQYGNVLAPPSSDYSEVTNFQKASQTLQGVPLSHTVIEIASGLNGRIYQVAIDNVFAIDYNGESYNVYSESVPEIYQKSLTPGQTAYFCSGNAKSVPYSVSDEKFAESGFDWVHTNCVAAGFESNGFTNGWLVVDGKKLTDNTTYCYLWAN